MTLYDVCDEVLEYARTHRRFTIEQIAQDFKLKFIGEGDITKAIKHMTMPSEAYLLGPDNLWGYTLSVKGETFTTTKGYAGEKQRKELDELKTEEGRKLYKNLVEYTETTKQSIIELKNETFRNNQELKKEGEKMSRMTLLTVVFGLLTLIVTTISLIREFIK